MTIRTIRMPDLGEGIAEVELVEWRVKPGDLVVEDQILCDVMTDKAAVEIPSSVAGRVVELGGEIGQTLAVGSVLIRIEGEAAAAAAAAQPEIPAAPTKPVPAPDASAPQTRTSSPSPTSTQSQPPSQRALAAPAVRARARALGLDLARLQGSGPDGRIVHADLDALRPDGGVRTGGTATEATREVKLIGLRRKIAQKMQESKRHIPHFTYVEEVDVTEMVALRDELNRQHGAARGELSPLTFIVRAVVRAVAEFPQVNARFDDEAGVLTLHEAVHLGVATQTDAGLIVPVLRQAQTLDLWACAAGIARLAASARAGKAAREDLSGSTITVTSLGKLGGIASTPVINHPEVAIVGINRIAARPVVHEGAVQVRQMMNLSSSFDHRVVDGALAAAYIQRVRQLLEHPAMLFIE
ncbi:MAG TPA: dihydrolipoamide acetyltransferase family protein [Burkholderiaceae bacterium]|nr:dihydrolipoamide acetyltransferase family protein [Burkholderiaceae bacterium]